MTAPIEEFCSDFPSLMCTRASRTLFRRYYYHAKRVRAFGHSAMRPRVRSREHRFNSRSEVTGIMDP